MGTDWLDRIEAQLDDDSPYYVPILIAEIRLLNEALDAADKRFNEAFRIVMEAAK
jgi:hypothetical protein